MRSWNAWIVALVVALASFAVHGEVGELRIPMGAGGFGFLPLYMMQKYKLIEKYAAESGVTVTVDWADVGGAAVMNDALLSGSAHLISAGPPAFLTLWDRTRGNIGVKGIAAISSLPTRVNARIADLKSLDDIAGNQRIAVGAVKVSIPSILMQMYALKKYGRDQIFRFDPFTVTLTHPDAVIALLSGNAAIVAHGASVPFDFRELKDPAIRTILNSYDVMDGPSTFTMMSTTTKFHDENPKLMNAVVKALKRAQEMIAADKRDAAEVLLASMGGKGWTIDELVQILNDPTIIYTTKPDNVLAFARFMYEIGSIKSKPISLSSLFFDTPETVGGN